MIAIFRIAFWTVTIIEFIAFIASIIIFALGRSSFIDYCVASPVEPSYTYETCSAYYRNFMIVYSIVVVIVNFIQVNFKPQSIFFGIYFNLCFFFLVLLRHSH